MTAGRIFFPNYMPARDGNGDAIAGAKAYFYVDTTTTLTPVYADVTLTTQLSNPVVADSVGVWPALWKDNATPFTVSLTDGDGAPLPRASWTGVSSAIDATLESAALAESAQAAAEAAEAGAETAQTAAEAARTAAQTIATAFGDLDTAVTGAEASAAAAAASAAAAAVFDPTNFALKATTIGGGGLVTGGGDLSANRTVTVTAAAAADVRTGTSTSKAMTPGDTYNALAEVALTDAATVAVDLSAGINFALNTIGGNRTLGNPTNPKVGQTGRIRIVQDGTGSRTLSYAGNWKFTAATAPALSTSSGAVDFLDFEVVTSTFIRASLTRAWA